VADERRLGVSPERLTHLFLLRTVLGLVAGVAFAVPAAAQPIAFRGAEIHTVAPEGILVRGTLVVDEGRIVAIGRDADVVVPDGAQVRDVSGYVIIPGMVDTHSHVGLYPRPAVPAHRDGNESSAPLQSQIRAIDAIWPEDPGIRMALAGGITTANVMPGSGNPVGGQTAYVKFRGDTILEMLVHADGVQGGMKMANGENPKRARALKGTSPMTRMAIVALQRELFLKAQAYQRKWELHREKLAAGEESQPPDRDLALEPMVEILEGKRTVHHHTHRADDIVTTLRLQREFGFDLVIQHGTEAYKVADLLAERGIPVSTISLDSPGGKLEVVDYRLEYAGLLERAGVSVAIHTDDFITPSRLMLRSGALAVRGGMSEDGALAALTRNGARMMRLDDRLGSLEVGKDADFVLLSGPPFSVYTHVMETWIDGERVFDRNDPDDRRYATGGFALGDAYPQRAGQAP